jgi:hypothetical protein
MTTEKDFEDISNQITGDLFDGKESPYTLHIILGTVLLGGVLGLLIVMFFF